MRMRTTCKESSVTGMAGLAARLDAMLVRGKPPLEGRQVAGLLLKRSLIAAMQGRIGSAYDFQLLARM